ncbi:nucleoside deaminase [Bacteroidales bacterium OttesenSCG-928-K03]|nr:nucleoside deaminase [Bacteroidales bacterium OttesenSCG-928-L14]MDL2241201.1 nucleoside deaminase [Bacteroidales bacterium OttesenSCG-928-K22]MDL2242866.1 nucleoside deaminase [Bacteroidales bacterium OttesenSCG-928-K03]
MNSDVFFMREALKEAKLAFEEGEIPIGAVAVYKDRIIARAHNTTERLNDCTAHAEILCITAANEFIGSKYLHDITIYVSLEPCMMCAGALFWSQVSKLVYAANDEKRGFSRHTGILHPKTEVIKGILKEEAESLLNEFFRTLREK